MQIKVFKAATMKEAMAAMKAELGEDAVILHSKKSKEGGVLGLGSRDVIEITAAVEEDSMPEKRGTPTLTPRPSLVPNSMLSKYKTSGTVEGVEQAERKLDAPTLRVTQSEELAEKVAAASANPSIPKLTEEKPDKNFDDILNEAVATEEIETPVETESQSDAEILSESEEEDFIAEPEENPPAYNEPVPVPEESAENPPEENFVDEEIPAPSPEEIVTGEGEVPEEIPTDEIKPEENPPEEESLPEESQPEEVSENQSGENSPEENKTDEQTNESVSVEETPQPEQVPENSPQPQQPQQSQQNQSELSPTQFAQQAQEIMMAQFNQISQLQMTQIMQQAMAQAQAQAQAQVAEIAEQMKAQSIAQQKAANVQLSAKVEQESQEKIQRLEDEIAQMKALLADVLGKGGRKTGMSLHEALRRQEVDEEILSEMATQAGAGDTLVDSQSSAAKITLTSYLNERIRFSDGIKLNRHGVRIVALLGTTGVGKTTTLAKIAAKFVLEQQISAALITADTYRISAVEQLKTYSDILGLPLEIVYSPAELSAAIERHRDKELILIDTAGRSQQNDFQMRELEEFLKVNARIEKHLVISATTKLTDAREIMTKFATVEPEKLIVTKIDETGSLGMVLNLLHGRKIALSYFTTGQSVPDDIENAAPEVFADLLLKKASGFEG